MVKAISDFDARLAMTEQGYSLGDRRNRPYLGRTYPIRTPDCKSGRVKIHKSGVLSGNAGRHWYGIWALAVKEADYIALWARGEASMFVIPTDFLRRCLQSGSKIENGQWHVNVYFRRSVLKPVDDAWGEYRLDEFSIPVTRHNRGTAGSE